VALGDLVHPGADLRGVDPIQPVPALPDRRAHLRRERRIDARQIGQERSQ